MRRHPQPAPAPPSPVATSSTSPFEQINNGYDSSQEQDGLENVLNWNNQSISTNPVPANITPEQQRQQQILQELPGIGTWAGRQRLFSVRPSPQLPNSQVEGDALTMEATESGDSSGVKIHNHPVVAVAGANGHASTAAAAVTRNGYRYNYENDDASSDTTDKRVHNGYTSTTTTTTRVDGVGEQEERIKPRILSNGDIDYNNDDEFNDSSLITAPVIRSNLQRTFSNTSSEARHISAAWKWRFTRRWEAEQRRILEADPREIAAEADGGDDLDALEYLHACGMGLDLQMLAADARQQRRRRRSGEHARGGSRGNFINNTTTTGGAPTTALLTNGANGRTKSGIMNTPEASRPSDTSILSSLRRDVSSASTATMLFDVEPSYASIGDLLSCEGSESIVGSYLLTPEIGGRNASNPAAATRDLLSVAIRGRELMQCQSELEKEAAARWEEIERNCCGCASTWAGNVVPPVDIGMQGKFYFVVLKMSEIGGGGGGSGGGGNSIYQLTNGIGNTHGGIVSDDGMMNRSGSIGTNRQRMLVRGRPKATPQELLDETISHASSVCSQNNLPRVSITMVGAGEMEWREDTDRHLMVSPAPKHINMKMKSLNRSGGGVGVVSGNGSPPEVPSGDVCALAASLLHQALPLHFSISTRAQNLASYASGTLL